MLAGFVLAKYIITPYLLSNRLPTSKVDKPTIAQPSEPVQQLPSQPRTDQPSQTPPPEAAAGTVVLPAMRLYKIQLGAFSTQANAEAARGQVQSKGLSAMVVQSGGAYRVMGAYTASQDGARAASAAYKRAGFETYVDALQISQRQVKTELDAKAVQSALNEGVKFLEEMAARWDKFYLGQGVLQVPPSQGIASALSRLSAMGKLDIAGENVKKLLSACKEVAAAGNSASPATMEKFMDAVNRYWFLTGDSRL